MVDEAPRRPQTLPPPVHNGAGSAEAAPRIRYHKQTYRINKRTKVIIATSFGAITVWAFYYLNEEDGEPGLHPLHEQLGITAGATPVLAEMVIVPLAGSPSP